MNAVMSTSITRVRSIAIGARGATSNANLISMNIHYIFSTLIRHKNVNTSLSDVELLARSERPGGARRQVEPLRVD